MVRCTFCTTNVDIGRGIIFVTAKGKKLHFCSRKCRRAFYLGRNKKKLGWIRKKRKVKKEQ